MIDQRVEGKRYSRKTRDLEAFQSGAAVALSDFSSRRGTNTPTPSSSTTPSRNTILSSTCVISVNDTFLPHLEREFEHKGNAYRLLISPGRVIYNNGTARNSPQFPEELVEALRKIACDRLNGVFLDGQAGVQFTLYELKKELKHAAAT